MTRANVLLLLAAVLLFPSCGDGDGVDFCSAFPDDPLCHKTTAGSDECSQAVAILFSGYDEGCLDYPDCCFCQCWRAGRQMPDSGDPCTCVPLRMPNCDQVGIEAIQECLASPAACRQGAIDNVAEMCAEVIVY